jgi:hypothetical protein
MATSDIINSIKTNLTNAYTKLNDKGATIPTNKNIENLASTIETVTGGGSATLQTKEITITENGTQSVTPDEGYDGLEQVDITTNVPTGGGDIPEKGFVVNNWDSDGFPTDISIYGLQTIPAYYVCGERGSMRYVTNITLPNIDNLIINNYCFYNSVNLKTLNNSNKISIVKEGAFRFCNKLEAIDLSNISQTILYVYTFSENYALKSVILPSNKINKISSYCFNSCKILETIALSDTLLTIGEGIMYAGSTSATGYTFTNCTILRLSELPETLTIIKGPYNFQNCTQITLSSLPKGLYGTLDHHNFENCYSITIKKIPKKIKKLAYCCFSNCTSISKMSMKSVFCINGDSSGSGAFYHDTALKKVWIGDKILNDYFERYTFGSCTSLEKMYIDLPRATVEAFTDYKYAFMGDTTKTGIIVCNDDEGFISKTVFDNEDEITISNNRVVLNKIYPENSAITVMDNSNSILTPLVNDEECSIYDLPGGSYSLVATYSNHTTLTKTITIVDGEHYEEDIKLKPSTMTEIEYIQTANDTTCTAPEGTGTWIDTGISHLLNGYHVKLKFERVNSGYIILFGYNAYGTYNYLMYQSNYMHYQANGTDQTFSPTAIGTAVEYEVSNIWDNSYVKVDGTTVKSGNVGMKQTKEGTNVYIFARSTEDSYYLFNSTTFAKLYYFQLYDENETLLRDYIPVKDASGEPCLYDRVSEQLFYATNGVSFIGGPDVTE